MENIFTLQKRATLAKVLRDAPTIGIIASTRQNLDTIGAALALTLALDQSQKSVQVVSSRDPLVEISTLFGIDRLKRSFDSALKQLTISFPFVEGEIEKAMYKTEGDKINVHFYAAQDKTITFKESDVKYIKKGGAPNVIFAIAVSDDEIKEFVDNTEGATIIRISRHPKDTSGTIVYQDPDFSSVSEIVAKIIQEQGLTLDADSAQNLLDGIVFSTHNFTSPKTSPFAFDATGFLLKKGAKRKDTLVEKESKLNGEETKPETAVEMKNEEKPLIFESAAELPKSEPQKAEPAPEEKQKTEVPVQAPSSEDMKTEDIPSDWFEPKVFKTSQPDS